MYNPNIQQLYNPNNKSCLLNFYQRGPSIESKQLQLLEVTVMQIVDDDLY